MNQADLNFLESERGRQALNTLASADLAERHTLALLTSLRREFSPEEAAAALSMARLRQKAISKFGDEATKMWFTADALEQASDPLVRVHRAVGLRGQRVLDVCCGIGADSLTFASAGAEVLGLDYDPIRVTLARMNARDLGRNASFEIRDVTQGALPSADTIFFDPARRDAQGKRIYDVEAYLPPLSLIKGWQAQRIMVKLSPGVDVSQLDHYGGSVTFISVKGDLKEAVLQIGDTTQGLHATLIDDAGVHQFTRTGKAPQVPISAPAGWLVEPDASLLRAGLVQDFAETINATMMDETIAYLSAPEAPITPWARHWQILDWMPYHLKRLRAYLRERQVGQVTVKKRGSPILPEELIKLLKLKGGSEARTLVLTRYEGQPIVIICAEYSN